MPFDQTTFTTPAAETFAPLSMAALMATPEHMLAWLRSKQPDDIVAEDMMDCRVCLGATFLRESGHPHAMWATNVGYQRDGKVTACWEIGDAIISLLDRGATTVTATEAIGEIDRAIAARRAAIASEAA